MEHFTTISGLCNMETSSDGQDNIFQGLSMAMEVDNQIYVDKTDTEGMQDQPSDNVAARSSSSEESEEKSKEKQYKHPLLPPCRVCGDQATGFHYGATTCEACKGFFRRSLVRKKEFTCVKGTNDCDVMAPKKAPCPGCRFQRCMAAGMSKNGIKRGRYSLVRKTHHIMEVKGLQSTDLSPAPSKLATQTSNSSASHSPDDVTPPSVSEGTVLPPAPCSRNVIPSVTKTVACEEFEKRKSLIDALCKSYDQYCRFPQDILNNIKKIQEDYANSMREHTEFFGPWDLVDTKTFLELYWSTGIDVDYRIGYFRHRIKNIEESICNLVAFAKSIPGFRSIVLADQMTLVKSVQFHWWFLCSYPGISNERKIYTSQTGDCVLKREMQMFTTEEYGDLMFVMAGLFEGLALDDTERALVIALCVFSSDFAFQDLQDFSSIDALHQEIGEALYFYTKRHKDPARFCHIIAALTELRSAEGLHIEGRNRAWKIFEESQFTVNVPPLVMELWAGMIPAVNPEKVMQRLSNGSQMGAEGHQESKILVN